tara:strand:+ start:66 stop:467 length:402 start_codon:yes stop_codon:yes gene_type:complete
MSIKKNSFKLFSFSFIFFITSCSSNVAKIEGTTSFSSKKPSTDAHYYHTVKYGDSLWSISSLYYENPLYWPDIYKHNTDKIYDADLILPGQSIIIHKIISPSDKGKAQAYAKNRGLWVVGYREESDIKFLENN